VECLLLSSYDPSAYGGRATVFPSFSSPLGGAFFFFFWPHSKLFFLAINAPPPFFPGLVLLPPLNIGYSCSPPHTGFSHNSPPSEKEFPPHQGVPPFVFIPFFPPKKQVLGRRCTPPFGVGKCLSFSRSFFFPFFLFFSLQKRISGTKGGISLPQPLGPLSSGVCDFR